MTRSVVMQHLHNTVICRGGLNLYCIANLVDPVGIEPLCLRAKEKCKPITLRGPSGAGGRIRTSRATVCGALTGAPGLAEHRPSSARIWWRVMESDHMPIRVQI